jgi:serine/threonine-protein kinase
LRSANVATSVESRYRILERIDSGGMAEVFKGRARAIHGIEKIVAIKRILPHLARNRKFVAMFLDEARLSVYLNHANIVQVFDIARSGGNYFIVMEYAEGSNLRRILDAFAKQGRAFPVEVAAYIGAQVSRALAYAHDRTDREGHPLRIVHRDVSPPNVLLTFEGEIKLVDFGLARAASQLEKSDPDILKGKLGYMSPEQAWGKDVDHRADIFATGILLFEMLAGRRLFRGGSDLETLELVRAARIPSLRTLNPRVPEPLERVVLRALTRDLEQRYQSAHAFEDDLWSFLFANRLKVTPVALGQWIRAEHARLPPPDESNAKAIDRMIYEEMLKITSIESYDLPEDPDPTVGGGNEGSRPISLDDLTVAPNRTPRPPEAPPLPPVAAPGEFGHFSEIFEPDGEGAHAAASRAQAMPPAPARVATPVPPDPQLTSSVVASHGGRAGWWLLAVLVLAGIGGAAYLLLSGTDSADTRGAPQARSREAKQR